MFVVAHFHMVMGVAPILVVLGAIYHWYPKITGRMLDERLGQVHFWVTFVGSYLIFFPMHYIGLVGVPRRYPELGDAAFIPDSVATLNSFISLAAFTVGIAQILFLYNIFRSLRKGQPSGHNPWRATTLEWQTALRHLLGMVISAQSFRSVTVGLMIIVFLVRRKISCLKMILAP